MTDQINEPQSPYDPPRASTEKREVVHYGGIGRLAYVGCWVGLLLIMGLIGMFLSPMDLFDGVFKFIPVVVFFYIQFALSRPRLKNMGYNPWLALLVIVPVANMWLMGVCVLCPPGYAATQQFDRPAKIMLGVLLMIFGVLIAWRLYLLIFSLVS